MCIYLFILKILPFVGTQDGENLYHDMAFSSIRQVQYMKGTSDDVLNICLLIKTTKTDVM